MANRSLLAVSQRLLCAPLEHVNAIGKSASFDADAFCPCPQRHGFTLESDRPVAPSIVGLLCQRGPAAVAGIIIAVVVDAIKGLASWAITHIRQEVLVGKPPLTDRDSSSTVAGVAAVGSAETPTPHRNPASPSACFLFGMAMTEPERVADEKHGYEAIIGGMVCHRK